MDLDDRNCRELKKKLCDILESCKPAPRTKFRFAIEETEAWLLGDPKAIEAACPKWDASALAGYTPRQHLWYVGKAGGIHPNGSKELKKKGYPFVGQYKCEWAEKIAPYMDVENNQSKSFQVFRDTVRELITPKTV